MDGQILETVTEWETVPVDDGADGLADLVDREFTGAVTDGVAWLFFLNGRGVGVADGSVEDFTGAELTARAAPDDSLPLLYAMMSDGTETRAKYYTEETPLSAAHETLESGGFTGFVELSENVLSGDYYVVYYGGRSLPVAFVGSSRKLLTGDEAFERADDEVGIYHVEEATVSILDLPTGDANTSETADDDTDGGETTLGVANEAPTANGGDDETPEDEPGASPETTGADETGADETGASDVGFDATAALGGDTMRGETEEVTDDESAVSEDTAAPDDEEATTADNSDREFETDETSARKTDAESVDDADTESEPADSEEDDAPAEEESSDEPERTPEVTFGGADSGGDTADDAGDDAGMETAESKTSADTDAAGAVDPLDDESVFDEEAQWRETQVIPPLSPDDAGPDEVTMADVSPSQPTRSQTNASAKTETEAESPSVAELRERLERAEAEREEAEERVAAAEAERDEVAEERDELREEAARHRERVESLEAEVERLEELVERLEAEDGTTAESSAMSVESALAGTSLFVRYDTKGGATLEKVRDGDADKETVNGNLRLEYHTTFDSDPATVDGDDFETFLYDTTEYEFVRWLVEDFIYELQDTGNTGSMQELYDVLPKIDRVEFRGSVSLKYHEGGEEHREQRTFDVVVRDRMGNALAVADINASREATGETELTSLVEGTKRLGETTDTVAAAFSVTASFFDPAALEVAAEETKSGLLGRSKGKSYVKLSRKSGFHLVLVESRHGQFHVNVPEL